jgi:lactoylglutathione lyase
MEDLAVPGEFPTEGVEVTHLLVVGELGPALTFYRDVLGATLHREYGGTSAVLSFQGSWLLLVTGGEPTEDKPTVTFAPPKDPDTVSSELTIRVPDCREAYDILRSRGASFLTPPFDWGGEIRCFFRDPDGHLLEISEAVSSVTTPE